MVLFIISRKYSHVPKNERREPNLELSGSEQYLPGGHSCLYMIDASFTQHATYGRKINTIRSACCTAVLIL